MNCLTLRKSRALWIHGITWIMLLPFLAGCAHQEIGTESWQEQSNPPRDRSILPDDESIASLNAIANNPTNSQAERASAIFTLFAHHIRPGATASEVHQTLTDTSWLQDTNVHAVTAIAGWIPIDPSFTNGIYWLDLFPADSDQFQKHWIIYFSLARKSEFESPKQMTNDAVAFLWGQSTSESTRLVEFALCFPPPEGSHFYYGRFETHSTNGIQATGMW